MTKTTDDNFETYKVNGADVIVAEGLGCVPETLPAPGIGPTVARANGQTVTQSPVTFRTGNPEVDSAFKSAGPGV